MQFLNKKRKKILIWTTALPLIHRIILLVHLALHPSNPFFAGRSRKRWRSAYILEDALAPPLRTRSGRTPLESRDVLCTGKAPDVIWRAREEQQTIADRQKTRNTRRENKCAHLIRCALTDVICCVCAHRYNS